MENLTNYMIAGVTGLIVIVFIFIIDLQGRVEVLEGKHPEILKGK